MALSRHIREVRLLLCKGPASEGAKQFVVDKYADIKKANPLLPFLVREVRGITPTLTARFDHGAEKVVAIAGLKSADVAKKLSDLGVSAP
jgi:NADH dehydrogenase (ubiquinone) 1 alpha subcomplex subunit 2